VKIDNRLAILTKSEILDILRLLRGRYAPPWWRDCGLSRGWL
jgi:hypothetical protein